MKSDDPTSLVATARVQEAVSQMLDKRGVQGEDEPYDVVTESGDPFPLLWSCCRSDVVVVCVTSLKKANAQVLIDAVQKCREDDDDGKTAVRRLIVVHTGKCTPMAADALRKVSWIEVWTDVELCVNPFKCKLIADAGVVSGENHFCAHMLRGIDPSNLPRLLMTDYVRRYLGAELGAVVWTNVRMGLEPEIKLRYVVTH
jgi:DNA-directed RNA polymerase subunit H (RpoH/RPB5)